MKGRTDIILLLLSAVLGALLFQTWRSKSRQPPNPPDTIASGMTEPEWGRAEAANAPSPVSGNRVTLPAPSSVGTEQIRQIEERGKREASLAVVADIYGEFLRQVSLDQDAADAFLNFTCDERLAALSAALAARANGIRWMDSPEAREQVMRGAVSRDADIRRLLGEKWYSSFEDFRASSNVRTTINQISDQLNDANALTVDQILQLGRTFLQLQDPRKIARAPADAVLQLIGMPVTDSMIEAARGALTDAQFAALLAVRDSQLQALSNPDRKTVGSPGAINPGTGTH